MSALDWVSLLTSVVLFAFAGWQYGRGEMIWAFVNAVLGGLNLYLVVLK